MLFVDKKHRDIEVCFSVENPLEIIAKDQDNVIGSFMFEDLGSGDLKLLVMDIGIGYTDCGIGAEMLKMALNRWKEFEVPKDYTQRSEGDGDFLTKEAVGFFNACCNKGICKQTNRKITL